MKIEPGASVTPNVRLVRPIGEGGMGEVWLAEHLALGTEVAVKFLLGDYAKDAAARSRFSQEAAAASQVKSSHVVKVYDYGITDDDVPFIVMEMLEGTDLAKRLETEKKIAPAHLVAIVTQLCKALARAHEKGVIHRDIKPENVFLGSEGGELFVKLLDFGIAKTETVLRKTTGNRRSTMAGESLGTPYYMSPEQFRSAKQIDLRSDLWSVGVLAYEALTGSLPFVAETVSGLAIVVNEGKAVAPSTVEPSLPPQFDAWFAKACAHAPSDRFQSAREMSDALRAALGGAFEAFDSSTSGPHRVVISQVGMAEASRLSLRDTAFATAGGSGPRPARRIAPIAGVVALASIALAVGLWVSRQHATQSATRSDPPSASAVYEAPKPSVAEPHASATAEATPVASAPPVASASATMKPAATHAGVRATPSAASSAPKGDHHGDIW